MVIHGVDCVHSKQRYYYPSCVLHTHYWQLVMNNVCFGRVLG